MKFIKKIAKKYKSQLKYLISGTIAAIVEFGLFNLLFYVFLKNHSLALISSQIISYASGFVTAFSLHVVWSFKTENDYKNSRKKQFIFYLLVAGINLYLSVFIITFLKDNLGIYSWLAKIITMGMVVIWNFVILNNIIFKTNEK